MIHSIQGGIHIISAVIALLAGTFVLLAKKGTLVHRQVGYVYTAAMVILNVTAFLIYDLMGHFGPFHIAAIVSSLTLFMGIRAAVQRKSGWYVQHYYYMAWSVVGLYAAFVAETGVRLVPMGWFWNVVFGSLGVIMFVASRMIRKYAPKNDAEAPIAQPMETSA